MPMFLLPLTRLSHRRWTATRVTAIYTCLWIAGLWIMPLFPAQARLAPVYTQITHMVPLRFPPLLLAPAVVLDVVVQRFFHRELFWVALRAAVGFVGTLLIVQWPFANFLVSPLARNRIFGMQYFAYTVFPSNYHLQWEFIRADKTTSHFLAGMVVAVAAATLSSYIGLVWGDWMRGVRR